MCDVLPTDNYFYITFHSYFFIIVVIINISVTTTTTTTIYGNNIWNGTFHFMCTYSDYFL